MKAKEKMKNVVVEIKESKLIKDEDDKKHKFADKRSLWGKKQPSGRERKKFDGKDKFERSRRRERNENAGGRKNFGTVAKEHSYEGGKRKPFGRGKSSDKK